MNRRFLLEEPLYRLGRNFLGQLSIEHLRLGGRTLEPGLKAYSLWGELAPLNAAPLQQRASGDGQGKLICRFTGSLVS
jgi:hypothetical protein